MLVYSPDYTHQSHLAAACLTDLNVLCQRDYGKSYFRNTVLCLDLDTYEQSQTGNADATMDAATGIADYQQNHASSPRHLLMELRFGYESTRNFDLGNMKRKVAHSRDMLLPEQVNPRVAFLYEPDVAPKAQSYFARLSRQDSELRSWDAMDVEGFNSYIVDSSTLPYQPENDLKAIEKNLNDKYASGGLEAMDVLVKYWIDQMEQYKLRYKYAESKAIAEVVLSVLKTIKSEPNSFEYEYIKLRIEDVTRFLEP